MKKTFTNLAYYLIAIVFACSCSFEPKLDNKIEGSPNFNPLDSILGEKLINESSGEIRQNNFSDFIKISKENLADYSALYNVSPLGTVFYRINQKKMYSEARVFSALVKIENDNVVKYHVANDFQILDQTIDSKGLFVLLGNFGNYNKYWKTNNEVQLIRFDNNLKQLWNFTAKSDQFPLEALEINSQDEYTCIKVNVITGCHICTNTYEIKVDSTGNCFSAIELDKKNSSISLNEQTIKEIFKIP